MNDPRTRGLPPRVYVPLVALAGIVLIATVAYFLRIGLGVTGSALGPSAQSTAPSRSGHASTAVPPVATRAPAEASIPQTSAAPAAHGQGLPRGNPVGGGGPAAGAVPSAHP